MAFHCLQLSFIHILVTIIPGVIKVEFVQIVPFFPLVNSNYVLTVFNNQVTTIEKNAISLSLFVCCFFPSHHITSHVFNFQFRNTFQYFNHFENILTFCL